MPSLALFPGSPHAQKKQVFFACGENEAIPGSKWLRNQPADLICSKPYYAHAYAYMYRRALYLVTGILNPDTDIVQGKHMTLQATRIS